MEESIEQELDAEVVHRAPEINRRLLAGADRLEIERMPGAIEHRELLGHLAIGVVVELLAHDRVAERGHVDGRLVRAARHAFEQVDFPCPPIEYATEARPIAERPDDRR